MTSEELALAAPTPETGSTSPPPVLNECVSVITAPDALSPHSSARKKGELSLSLLGFCYHVAKDHAILSKAISDNKMKDLQFSDIPAIRELLANPEVFNAFVSMLTPPSSGGSSGVGANPQQMTIGRKRAPSEDLTYSRKNQMLSPVLNRAQMNPEEKTQLPTAVLAATILGTVFQHVDHWPIQLIKSFAEDSFGPRAWVDDDRCSVLVANLEQSINLRHEVARLNDAIVSAAEEAEKYFSSLSTSNANSCRSVARSTSIQSKEPSSKEKQKLKARSKIDTDTSSSSGEEEVLESEILPCFSIASLPEQSHSLKDSFLHMLFSSNSASTEQVRPRYVSSNVELMYEVVSEALEERLNSKSKQNSRLLQTLPLFLQIPRVRVLASRHLERWLQSPALAGLARTLFAEIARHVEKVDPPLFDDVEVVDNILKLKLKANQLALFVEHLAAVVKTLPSVAKQVFTYCITKGDLNCESVKDKLQILRAVYVTLDRKNAAATLASSIIALESEVIELGSNRDKIILQYKELYAHLSQVVDMLDTAFDGFLFAESVIEAKSGTTLESNAENSSRLIFFCATLITRSVSSFERTDKVADDSEELSQFRTKILKFRKSIMKWCVEDLSPVYYKKVKQEEERKCLDSQFEHGVVVSGPGMADYNSVLNADSKFDISGHRSSFQQLMSIMRCLLFLCQPSSSDMDFLFGERLDDEHCKCVEFYCNNGVDIDDELLQLVLNCDKITPNTAISLIESLVECCNVSSAAKLVDCSSKTVVEMYKLAEYKPELLEASDYESTDDSKYTSDEDAGVESRRPESLNVSSLPRLAVTSLWWRVSCIALVLCGLSPEVGATLWNQNPTIRSLIKMTTSQKYRFPTADCDEAERKEMKQMEANARETEANIVSTLFMPRRPRKLQQIKKKSPKRAGMRFSARQMEKQDKLRLLEEERNAALLHAEHLKLKKALRSMQKNVMLFDPKQYQRKPPKGSIDLLLSVNKRFGLAEKFRDVTTPMDFLLHTIGNGRSAIERAYDWLIPVISSHEEIIHRLQPNASCFLLLRAYGTEGEKNRELLDLAKPLLCHVKGCLIGEHGERHAMLAMELLMSDISDEHVNRRVCSRRVLQEAFGGESDTVWLSQTIHDKHSAVFVPLVITSVSRACAYEKGEVLSTYILFLSKYRDFLQEYDFNGTLCELISSRPHVFAEAFERFSDLRILCISEVKHAIDHAIAPNKDDVPSDPSDVIISVKSKEFFINKNVLGAFIVLMSNWQKGDTTEEVEEEDIIALLNKLIVPVEQASADSLLSTAMLNGKRAVSVEEWVRLATSKADIIAKQAALSVPDIFLPRLLLCSGMSKMSFVTMIERLNKLSDSVSDTAKLYNELISNSAVSEWGMQKGNRAVIKKRLQGRIASYLRIFRNKAGKEQNELNAIAGCAFVTWLESEVSTSAVKKSDSTTQVYDEIIINLNASALSSPHDESIVDLEEEPLDLSVDTWVAIDGGEIGSTTRQLTDDNISEEHINSIVETGQYKLLDETLEQWMNKAILLSKKDASAVVKALMNTYVNSNCDPSLGHVILKFVPQLRNCSHNDNLWQTIFVDMAEKSIDEQYLLSLVYGCVVNWSDQDVAACEKWILTQNGPKNVLSMSLMIKFLVVSSDEKSVHYFYPEDKCESNFVCVQSKDNVVSTMKIVLQYLEMTSSESSQISDSEEKNNLPDWLILTLIMAKSHQTCIVEVILEEIDCSSKSCAPTEKQLLKQTKLYSVILRLYLMFPSTFRLSDPNVKNKLIKAAKLHTKKSLQWRCPLDSPVSELLRNLGTSPHTRLVQSAIDYSKTQPLIVIRHLCVLHERLVTDGLGQEVCTRVGRVGTRPPTLVAQIADRAVNVSVVRWGFSYNESIWSSVLDLMMSLPAELLFTCGLETGLIFVLEDYLKLFYAHIIDLGSEGSISQIRPKFVALVLSFRSCNSVAFQNWTKTDISGCGSVQTLLLSKVGTVAI